VFSLVAQWMMTRKLLENWALWIALDVVYIWMFVARKGLYVTAFQYAVFLLLAAFGLRDWGRSHAARRAGDA
jgi:nicotinamide mononucleotide transporter